LLGRHPDVLALSEVFSAIGPERAFERPDLDGVEAWELFGRPRAEAAALLARARIPEVLARTDGRDASLLAPLMLVCLPALADAPERLFEELRQNTIGERRGPARDAFERLFDWLRARTGRTLWLERSGGSLAYVDRIVHWWPRARLVHLWRHGADCARSMYRHPYFRVAVARARNPVLDVATALAMEPPLDRFAAYWTSTVLRGLGVLARHDPERVLTVRYEVLVQEPRCELARIATFLGVDPIPQWLSWCTGEVRLSSIPPQHTGAHADTLDRLCAPAERALLRHASGR
jgi:hypothetical protein